MTHPRFTVKTTPRAAHGAVKRGVSTPRAGGVGGEAAVVTPRVTPSARDDRPTDRPTGAVAANTPKMCAVCAAKNMNEPPAKRSRAVRK